MRVLVKDRADLIEALVAEVNVGRLTTALLEKDEHLTDALRAVFALEFEFVELVFCGGTSLSKAHGLIERMSEDADLKVVLTDAGRPHSTMPGQRRSVLQTLALMPRLPAKLNLFEYCLHQFK